MNEGDRLVLDETRAMQKEKPKHQGRSVHPSYNLNRWTILGLFISYFELDKHLLNLKIAKKKVYR